MDDHKGLILERQGAQRLGIIEIDRPGRIEFYVPAGIGNGLERERRGKPVVLPLLVGIDANIHEPLVRRRKVELQTTLD